MNCCRGNRYKKHSIDDKKNIVRRKWRENIYSFSPSKGQILFIADGLKASTQILSSCLSHRFSSPALGIFVVPKETEIGLEKPAWLNNFGIRDSLCCLFIAHRLFT